jgi:hypothetical protein
MKIQSPSQLPQMLADIERQKFYGQIHLTFRRGQLARIITEQSQVFNDPNPQERTCNDRAQSFPK